MIDFKEIQKEWATSYSDKARIYFIEKYLSTFDADAGKRTQFLLFPRQKVFLHSIAEHGRSIAIKHRQAGITTVTAAWVAAQIALADKEKPETVLCIGNKLDLSNQLVTKIREFLMQVPRWYWGNEYYSPDPKSEKNFKDIFTKNSKSELQLFNGCSVYARSSGENAARGISAVSILIFDEAAFIENGTAVYSSAVAATSTYGDRAKIVMVSTPNGKDKLYYNTYRQAITHENNYNAVEFKWYQDLRYNKFLSWSRKNEKTGEVEVIVEDTISDDGSIKYDEEKWRKLEREGWKPTSPWYESMCKSFNNDSMKIAQELDVSFMGSSDNVIAPEYIEMQNKLNVREPLEDFKDPMLEETWFWKKPIDGHRYILACLPEGEQVLTQRGLINVEDVKEEDLLVTKEGEYTNTVKKMVRDVSNESIIKLKMSNLCEYVSFTWNHPIYASCNTKLKRHRTKTNNKRYWDWNFDYVNAKDVNINDWVQMPNIYASKVLTDKEILSHWKNGLTRTDFKIKNPLLNEEFWWFCGMWLAEGWVAEDKHGNLSVHTCHNITETEIIEKISNLAKNIFNRKATITVKEKNNIILVGISSKELSNFMNDNFGKYAKFKNINEWIKFLPNNLKIQLIKGYIEGDGYIEKNKLYCGFTSISSNLLKSVQDILFSFGIISNLKLHVKEGIYKSSFRGGCLSFCQNKYELTLGKYDTQELLKLFKIESDVKLRNRRIIKDIVFSEDNKTIYFRISDKIEEKYTGKVYNFETKSTSHTFCCRGISTHNCDPSRGTSADRTAIEVIDMDGRDENGMPIIEQVAEYVGKKLGDEIGAIAYQYATMYNDAFVVVDATGGQGDAAILTMLQMGYKNMYYEDMNQKTYTIQRSTKIYDSYTDKLPGFHFQGNRYPVLANFAGLIRNNEFKVRSARVINELDTWIFKGENARMDHMEGSHDDTITSLAMGLFVMQFSVHRLENTIKKDKAILNAYMMTNTNRLNKPNNVSISMTPRTGLPFYNGKNMKTYKREQFGTNMWLFGGLK